MAGMREHGWCMQRGNFPLREGGMMSKPSRNDERCFSNAVVACKSGESSRRKREGMERERERGREGERERGREGGKENGVRKESVV